MAARGRDQSNGRNGSESSDTYSWLSQDTIRDNQNQRARHPHRLSHDRGISPHSLAERQDRPDPPPPLPVPNSSTDLYASNFSWDPPDVNPNANGPRKALAVLGTDDLPPAPNSALPPRPYRKPTHPDYFNYDPYAPPHSPSFSVGPSDGATSFLHDLSEPEAPPAAGAASRLADDEEDDNRRPSVASASSQGSKTSSRFRKRLQGFFGDEYGDSKPDSETASLHARPAVAAAADQVKARERANSDGGSRGRAGHGHAPRPPQQPGTPLPSSEITPWLYQSFNDIPQFGEAPVRPAPTGPDGHRAPGQSAAAAAGARDPGRRHFGGHRHSRSKEEKPTVAGDLAGYPARPATGRDDLTLGLRPSREALDFPTPASSSGNLAAVRSTSPTPSVQSAYGREYGQGASPSPVPGKRSILDKIRRPKAHGPLKNLGAKASTQEPSARAPSKLSRRDASPARRGRQGSLETTSDVGDGDRKKDSRGLIGFRGRGGPAAAAPAGGKDLRPDEPGVWELDTDLTQMEGILRRNSPARPVEGRTRAAPPDGPAPAREDVTPKADGPSATGNWDAPDSWHVKRPLDENTARLPSRAQAAVRNSPDADGISYFIRVFRIDSTFATLSTGLYATVADILLILGRKSFLTDHLNNYEIVMQKNDLSRQLDPSEKPILMQKRMLEQVGYTQKDRIEEIGREDHSYILRFTFLPTKLSGYSSLQGEPGFNPAQKFSQVDLQGRSLVTIPIALYKRNAEIISLNLSRNLALDVPTDFINGCINLREIKFIGNEATRLPPSLSLASRLTYLDVSNNLLESLDHAHLDRLHGLVSIKMANNKLTKLPSYFGNFQYLRTLNLSSNNFHVFPNFLCDLKSLVDLDISFNSIAELPNIGRLTALERLWMTNNVLRGPLDETFRDLVNLREIDARFNEITNIDVLSQLPRLEQLFAGHNAVSRFRGSFVKMRTLVLDHCPMTQFDVDSPIPTLTSLNIASAKLVQFRDSLFDNVPNLVRLVLDKNHFVSMSPYIGKLRKLEHFSMIKNPLSSLPATIGCLLELKYLNLRECNLRRLPPEIWHCFKLETLNVSSNVLDSFPAHGSPAPQLPSDLAGGLPAPTPSGSTAAPQDDPMALDEREPRRPSQASTGALSVGGSPNGTGRRKPSVASITQGGRKVSTASRSLMDGSPSARKDSNFSQHIATTFGGSLRNLYLADNSLEDDVFRELSLIPDLRVVNLSYNEITELPQGLLKRWHVLTELYLSGNVLTSLPSDDLDDQYLLKVLHLNGNRFQVLPAELCKVSRLVVLDVGSNGLKYNVSNWPYDWNWNWNRNLKYLNFSGNKRLEIKPNITMGPAASRETDLTDFNSLTHLRVLGLMDVTLTTSTIPEETEDRRVRTSASLAGSLAYGMADTLGRTEHLSIIDMIVPRLKPDNVETLVGMFDGQVPPTGGSRIAKYLHENFIQVFSSELKRLRPDEQETPLDALRRAFLALNKNMAFACYKSIDQDIRQYREDSSDQKRVRLTKDDIRSGGVATVMYLNNMDLYVANVGDAQAILVKADGSLRHLTRLHNPAEPNERARIRTAGGYVSRNGKLNDELYVSRSFGHFQLMPAVIAAPHTMHVNLTEQDEMIILASRELWDYVTPDLVVDVTRAERSDLMTAAQKIRDLALAYGATNKLMVMILGVSELKKRGRYTLKNASMSMGPPDEHIIPSAKRPKKTRDLPSDSRLARFDYVDAPIGELAIIFTDIKKSTSLWETCPDAMRSAIQIHNDILRRQLGIIGGYEVKTEGDAFMVAFATTTAALLWCFNCQTQLLDAEWPTEVLEQPQCQVQYDVENNVIFRGLSVRMGVHWGEPVCEKDPVTNRMDYFGPMVNRASRISAEADGGQVFVSSDFMSDFQRNLEVFADTERAASTGSMESYSSLGYNIRRELQQLNSQGFVIKDQGERKLKGLENPEPLYLIYPHSLSGRLSTLEHEIDADQARTTISKHSQLEIQTDLIWRLWEITLRLERLCGALEYSGEARLKEPNVALFNVVKNHGGELADSTVLSLVEQQVTRIEVTINTLAIRNMMHPFRPGDNLNDHAIPIGEVMQQLQTQLAEYRLLKKQVADNGADIHRGPANIVAPDQYLEDSTTSASPSSSYLNLRSNSDVSSLPP